MTDEELLIKAAEERSAIVSKYDQGRGDGAQIDPWEDPEFKLYQVTDRYSFIHDERPPDYTQEEKELENRRLKKWLKMLSPSVWDRDLKTGKLKRRLYKGVPDAVRGEVWSRLLRVEKTKKEQQGKYEEMKMLARQWSPDLRQIDLDVNRTYRNHLMFRDRYGGGQQNLFHVLAAYSVYNSEIGYCQGMSQIAALLLMYMNEEDAFWGLSNLMADSKWAMHGFFIPGFPKLLRFQLHHDKILGKFLPKLKKHFDRQNIDAGLYTLKWFFQCFLDRVPFSLTLRLWDIYLYEGENLLVSTSYSLLKMHRRTLTRMGMEEIVEFLQIRLAQNFGYSDNEAVENVEKCMEELRRMKLELSRQIPNNELPQKPFGIFVPPSTEACIGRRRAEFSDEEKRAQAAVVARLNLQAMSQPQGSYLSIDDVSFDPSFDDVSSGVQRSSRSSLAGTSVTSAADISTVSATASQRYLVNEEEVRSLSHNSVVSIDKDRKDNESGQQTPTVVTECAVIHFHRPDDAVAPSEPFPATPITDTPTSEAALDTPTFSAPSPVAIPSEGRDSPSYSPLSSRARALSLETPTNPDLPPLAPVVSPSFMPTPLVSTADPSPEKESTTTSNRSSSSGPSSPPPFQIMRIEESRPRSRQHHARMEGKDPVRHSTSPDRVLIYVPFGDGRPESPQMVNGAGSLNGLATAAVNTSVSSSLTDPNRVVIHVERTGAVETVSSSSVKRSKSPSKKGAKSKTSYSQQSSRL